jgi:hypothetical protein
MNETEAQNGGGGNLRGLQPMVLLIIVCVAGACVGALFGAIASVFFGSPKFPLGTVLGAVGGGVAGFCWTWIMLGYSRTGLSRGKLVFVGTGWGIIVGLLATAILQGGLFIQAKVLGHAVDDDFGIIILIWMGAAVCAVVGGAITGAICGCIVPLKE